MTNLDDNFLKDLQIQCFKEYEEYFAGFREGLTLLMAQPFEALALMMKSCHSLKGNLQAVGFVECGEFVHSLESAIVHVETSLKASGRPLKEDDTQVLEFFLSDAIQGVEGYCKELAVSFKDEVAMHDSRKYLLTMIATWQVEDAPTSAPATAELPGEAESAAESAEVGASTSPENLPPVEIPAAPIETPPAPVALTPEAMEVPNSGLYLLCQNGARHLGVRIDRVVKIVQRADFLPVANSSAGYLGLMQLQGEVLPILNLRSSIGEESKASYVVVCKNGARQFGFLVEQADKVVELSSKDFQAATPMHIGTAKKIISNFCNFDTKTVLIVDLDRALEAA